MEPIYRHCLTVGAEHTDPFQRAKPAALLCWIQEASGHHSEILGAGWENLQQKNLFWAVIRHRVQVTRLPLEGETITLETWPLPTTRAAYPRSVVAYDQNGRELFRAISLWVLMDAQSRALVLPGKSGVDVPGQLTGTELAAPRNILPMVLEHATSRHVHYSQLDRNGHMNNTRYLDWVEDLLPSLWHREHPVREFTVCYHSEALEGQQINLSYQLLDGPCLQVDAHRENTLVSHEKDRVFSVQMVF